MEAFQEVRLWCKGRWGDTFKIITANNDFEFSLLPGLESLSNTLVYFAHLYTFCEKESVGRHNGLTRRFIPKGRRIDSLSNECICQIKV